MANLPEIVSKGWDNRDGAIILTTVDSSGMPNSIYATCVKKHSESQIVVADNYFDKTRSNIKNGSKGSILFITKNKESYQLKGSITYHTDGGIFTDMKRWLDSKFPGHAAAVLNVSEVYSGAKKLA
jgi:predicted pyridoxine 5'-phosphate oxidase superfamily flavin-nucleotide-binding protein